ncbi:MerR family transcriptional regulator [Nonomuraea jabiensis]|uniref:HTH merR-type domain-containing protein n=1 Tax=Nonomuraea jabiensis TaxID=882448 RepID=A0A7W9GC37_9ACTN|nr:MerR family transcriptional regulator [Nonomuraea jabiensis]MBB5781021.1 hypothetical protein [Nonomuraea jabiensis]
MTDGVTIGQAAAFAGVTGKTARHYHEHGLINEPRRDNSGYRCSGSADLLRLVQVRPPAEIGAIRDADLTASPPRSSTLNGASTTGWTS